MISKIFKIVSIIIFFLYQNSLYSKTPEDIDFNPKYLSNYLSAIMSYDNQNNEKALKFFNSSRSLINKHDKYLKEYVFSLVISGKVKKSINLIKLNKNQKNTDFFEANLLLLLDGFKNKKFKENSDLLKELQKFQNNGTYEFIIYNTLKSYNDLFENRILKLDKKKEFGNLSNINETLQSCYLGKSETNSRFVKLINSEDVNYSRYLFFYLNYLINNKEIDRAKQIAETIDELRSNLLISQGRTWIKNSNFDKFNKIFSCKNESHLLGEFFFIIANFLSSQEKYEESNFYLYLSNYLNPNFHFNLTHLVENHFDNKNYDLANKILKNFKNDNEVYYWYRLKKNSQIISKQQTKERALTFIEKNFKDFSNPSVKILFDLGNIYKNNKEFKKSINFYSLLLSKLNESSEAYADVLYKRGGSYERIGDNINSDKDLIKSLSIKPDDPYVMNYLAYSWLERKYKIDEAIEMLEKAYQQKRNDPYIIDSVGWGYYLTGDFVNAEKFLQRAIELMPYDPIVNDHYGDILWKLNRKIEATYYWESVLKSKDAEEDMKRNISIKLLKGLRKS